MPNGKVEREGGREKDKFLWPKKARKKLTRNQIYWTGSHCINFKNRINNISSCHTIYSQREGERIKITKKWMCQVAICHLPTGWKRCQHSAAVWVSFFTRVESHLPTSPSTTPHHPTCSLDLNMRKYSQVIRFSRCMTESKRSFASVENQINFKHSFASWWVREID